MTSSESGRHASHRDRRPIRRNRCQSEQPAKRKLINTGTDKRYVRRDRSGKFKESDDVGRSLAKDRQTKAKTKARAGQGDKGDR